MSKRLPRVAINGFGRIGRCLARKIVTDPNPAFEWVAVNDLIDRAHMSYLLRYDSTHGRLDVPVEITGDDQMQIGDLRIHSFAERDPTRLPWKELEVDLVVESSGVFRKRSQAALHLEAGAKRVLISAPGDKKDTPDITAICGINDGDIEPDHQVISAASCTTTCLAPLVRALHRRWGVESGSMTTVHAYTKDQSILDGPHKDPRRGRSAGVNLVPTSTGAATAIGLVVPELAGKISGMAIRTPHVDASLVDLTVCTSKAVTVEEINDGLRAECDALPPEVMRVTDDPIVSSDIIGEATGCVVDLALTAVQGGRLVKVIGWYDNEWGYTSRMYALIDRLVAM